MYKEIEELLNYIHQFVYVDQSYNDIKLSKIDCKLILSHIEQVVKENKILRENAEHNDKVVDKVNWEINILKHNKDKAIEIIKKDWYKLNSRNIDEISDTKTDIRITLYNILKGDSE